MNPILEVIGDIVSGVGDVLSLFTKPEVLPFIGLAFVAAAIGTARKLIPVRKK